jgi:hypothetical protein
MLPHGSKLITMVRWSSGVWQSNGQLTKPNAPNVVTGLLILQTVLSRAVSKLSGRAVYASLIKPKLSWRVENRYDLELSATTNAPASSPSALTCRKSGNHRPHYRATKRSCYGPFLTRSSSRSARMKIVHTSPCVGEAAL